MELFDKNATALIAAGAALFSALIAGGFALLGAWLNNRQNNQSLKLKIEHEKSKESRRVLLEKGEEAFACATNWATSSRSHLSAHNRYMHGLISLKERDALIKACADPDTFYRLHILIPIYFPELHERLSLCGSYLERANKIAYGFHPDLSDTESDLKLFSDARIMFSENLVLIKIKLQKELASKVSK
ncbi:hypothetical protein IFU23_23345 [Pantoea agglomerans]|uniref:hypothetical protein n=1 Tax=Enterobacter agglomerans TaxID=549 RepID=UPI001786D335|nr:hypothetical protein [Pantoea agglomerans]MBD8161025.1 hypothetical protein [Pantoea agglomerans]